MRVGEQSRPTPTGSPGRDLNELLGSNRFLASLPGADLEALRPHLVPLFLARDQVVVEEGESVDRVFFPSTCLLSALMMLGKKRVETFAIGAEGAFGLLSALGARTSPNRVIVQAPGWATTIPAARLGEAALQRADLLATVARFAQAAAAQAQLNGACNALHDARQRLCRWLLMTADRIGSPNLPLTQEHLSTLLGVQRTTVTALAADLQQKRLVRYSRGRLTLLDRTALHALSCECYDLSHAQAEAITSRRSGDRHGFTNIR